MLQVLVLALALAAPPEPQAAREGPGAVFLPNGGQWPEAARFRRVAGGGTAWFVDDGWWLVLRGERSVALRMSLEGAAPVRPAPEDPRPGRTSFLLGSDPDRWAINLPGAGQVRWREPWPGIDLVARPARAGGAGVFEYDLELQPGARLEDVALTVEGHASLTVDPEGSLVVETAAGPVVQAAPTAWQVVGGRSVPMKARFRRLDDGRFGFEAEGRDPRFPAVIDPALVFNTYLSGQLEQIVEEVESAPGGAVIVAGTTPSDDFPTTPGAFEPDHAGDEDGFVSCLSADGSKLLWSTFLGGGDADYLRGMAVDPATGNVTVCGDTLSSDFPTTAGSFDPVPNGFFDAFAARLSATGDALLWSTYLGGGLNDRGLAVAVDPSGAATVAGTTNGSGFPVVPGSYDTSFNGGNFGGDAFCLRVDAGGAQLVWSTFLGGAQNDGATAVAVESTGEVTVAGVTSGGFPVTAGAFDPTFSAPLDAWVGRLDAAGKQLEWATYLGGSGTEEVNRIELDGSGASTLVGWTDQGDFPIAPGALDPVFAGPKEGFLLRLNATGSGLDFGTFVGGDDEDDVTGLTLLPGGGLVVVGNTLSDDYGTTAGSYAPAFHKNLNGVFHDVFVTRFTPGAAAVDYSTYFGSQNADFAYDVDVDTGGVAVFGGWTASLSFPTTPGAFQESFHLTASKQGFVARLAFLLHPITYGAPKATPSGEARIHWTGFPGLSDPFQIEIHGGVPGKKALLFHGFAPQNTPFWGGAILVQPPLKRHRPVFTNPFGYKSIQVGLDPAWVGQHVYFQFWLKDPNASFKVGMSDGLDVLVHP